MKRQKAAMQQTPKPAPAEWRPPPADRFLRWVGTLFVLGHFTAILAAASSVGPASELVFQIWSVCRPYLQLFYLNHGYNFYAPEPVPSTLLDYVVEAADGTVVASGRIPDHSLWPRLLYQRQLLLTEHIPVAQPAWQKNWCARIARHLCRKYGAATVRLTRLTHSPPTMEMVRQGFGLDDPVTYVEEPAGEFSCGDF